LPVKVKEGMLGEFVFGSLSSGGSHSCGVVSDTKSGYCWGSDNNGQLGNDTYNNNQSEPGEVFAGEMDTPEFLSMDAGLAHTCAISLEGKAYCWGSDTSGQLGNDTTGAHTQAPSAVVGGRDFVRLSAGSEHTCGTSVDGSIYCWGSNLKGQLGSGLGPDSEIPVAVDMADIPR
jgi:alpha-tubulin suppressor-like RCC1 family protein